MLSHSTAESTSQKAACASATPGTSTSPRPSSMPRTIRSRTRGPATHEAVPSSQQASSDGCHVSVSCPPRTASSTAARRWAGPTADRPAKWMALHAPWNASTTQPLRAKSRGRPLSRLDPLQSGSRPRCRQQSKPARTSSSPVRTDCRTATHHRPQASCCASGSAWVRSGPIDAVHGEDPQAVGEFEINPKTWILNNGMTAS